MKTELLNNNKKKEMKNLIEKQSGESLSDREMHFYCFCGKEAKFVKNEMLFCEDCLKQWEEK